MARTGRAAGTGCWPSLLVILMMHHQISTNDSVNSTSIRIYDDSRSNSMPRILFRLRIQVRPTPSFTWVLWKLCTTLVLLTRLDSPISFRVNTKYFFTKFPSFYHNANYFFKQRLCRRMVLHSGVSSPVITGCLWCMLRSSYPTRSVSSSPLERSGRRSLRSKVTLKSLVDPSQILATWRIIRRRHRLRILDLKLTSNRRKLKTIEH